MELPEKITCGYFDCTEFGGLTHSPARTAIRFEIEYYLTGEGCTMVNDAAYQIRPDYIQIAKPGQVRHSELPFTTFFLKFEAKESLARELLEAPDFFPAYHAEEIKECLRELILLHETVSQDSLLFHAKLLALLVLILEDSRLSQAQNGQNLAMVRKAQLYMEQHFGENIHLADIAASVNVSPIYFHQLFSGLCGLSPREYLVNYRIRRAKEMLWDSENSIGLIAESCGFNSQQYMNQVFRKQLGITPGQYRKQMNRSYME